MSLFIDSKEIPPTQFEGKHCSTLKILDLPMISKARVENDAMERSGILEVVEGRKQSF
jgi:hypothetical protein